MPEVNPCEARQCSDQMVCHKCDLGWDMNDPDPPECGLARRRREVEELSGSRSSLFSKVKSVLVVAPK